MSRYIDADKIDYTMASVYWGKDSKGRDVYRRTFVSFKSDIDILPTADVVEVVRCEKCRLRKTEDCPMMVWDVSGELMGDNQDNDFCSYGERREE